MGYIVRTGRKVGLEKDSVQPATKIAVIRPENGKVWKGSGKMPIRAASASIIGKDIKIRPETESSSLNARVFTAIISAGQIIKGCAADTDAACKEAVASATMSLTSSVPIVGPVLQVAQASALGGETTGKMIAKSAAAVGAVAVGLAAQTGDAVVGIGTALLDGDLWNAARGMAATAVGPLWGGLLMARDAHEALVNVVHAVEYYGFVLFGPVGAIAGYVMGSVAHAIADAIANHIVEETAKELRSLSEKFQSLHAKCTAVEQGWSDLSAAWRRDYREAVDQVRMLSIWMHLSPLTVYQLMRLMEKLWVHVEHAETLIWRARDAKRETEQAQREAMNLERKIRHKRDDVDSGRNIALLFTPLTLGLSLIPAAGLQLASNTLQDQERNAKYLADQAAEQARRLEQYGVEFVRIKEEMRRRRFNMKCAICWYLAKQSGITLIILVISNRILFRLLPIVLATIARLFGLLSTIMILIMRVMLFMKWCICLPTTLAIKLFISVIIFIMRSMLFVKWCICLPFEILNVAIKLFISVRRIRRPCHPPHRNAVNFADEYDGSDMWSHEAFLPAAALMQNRLQEKTVKVARSA